MNSKICIQSIDMFFDSCPQWTQQFLRYCIIIRRCFNFTIIFMNTGFSCQFLGLRLQHFLGNQNIKYITHLLIMKFKKVFMLVNMNKIKLRLFLTEQGGAFVYKEINFSSEVGNIPFCGVSVPQQWHRFPFTARIHMLNFLIVLEQSHNLLTNQITKLNKRRWCDYK